MRCGWGALHTATVIRGNTPPSPSPQATPKLERGAAAPQSQLALIRRAQRFLLAFFSAFLVFPAFFLAVFFDLLAFFGVFFALFLALAAFFGACLAAFLAFFAAGFFFAGASSSGSV